MAEQPNVRWELGAGHWFARFGIAFLNGVLVLFFAYMLFMTSIYLTASLSEGLHEGHTTVAFFLIALGSLATVIFSATTAVAVVRHGHWKLAHQLLSLAGMGVVGIPWFAGWTP